MTMQSISTAIVTRSAGLPLESWINVFSPETWQICGDHEFTLSAFPLSKRKTASSIRNGDLMFAYVTKAMCFMGVLEATGSIEIDMKSDIFGPPGRYPLMLPVRPRVILDDLRSVPLDKVGSRLTLMRGIDKRNWPYALRTSPRRLSRKDSEFLFETINLV
jgi:hypothetical protein